jgi:transcriptional regulator with XRE-family HTH domain
MAQVIHRLVRRTPNDPAYVALREQLVDARKRADLTQQQLADLVGRPQSFVAKIEAGERFLDAVELIALAKTLNLNFEDLTKKVLRSL